MPGQANPRRPKRGTYSPRPEILSLLKTSGNTINGLGEVVSRRASPFFWHPPTQHPFGDLQIVARQNSRKCPGSAPAFMAAYNHPELVPITETRNEASAQQLAAEMTAFALAHEVDAVGIAAMKPLYVFEGYTIEEPWVIVLVLAHNYEQLIQVPSDETNGIGVTEIGVQYARGTRASYALANWIRSQGYKAKAYPGPSADALLLIPPAVDSGLGELGKHGSLISPQFGSGIRLAGVTTNMPLEATSPVRFGADQFCATCQICTNACPPGAISEQKQMVRGLERWYVNFDKCIPYFAEAASCGICFAECPWTRPTVRPKLLSTMAKRLEETDGVAVTERGESRD
ncbi:MULTISPECIES: 4Fe-4S dicluster domain-containing protein [Acidobacteriaceae]|uniref:4Fe-4S dicluster domain-containing protein n=1 Tax=Acidobacteriaceae TaxID=204434 RepID=UPI00131EBD58|nr:MULTISPECIES: 4Fe-4S dicluster domain-containing protein [Acidobacteriaceae]MDW5267686.1 4Fe-4S dicluster domain-containing protein [Edaphobacter sp.]